MSGPFAGVRVIDLGSMIAGPGAATFLSDQGADVIKVEPPGIGDVMRYLSSTRGGVSGLYHNINRGKRSIAIDLKNKEGVALVRALAAQGDVVLQNFRPGVAERLGVDYESLRAHNPNIIYLSASGFGDKGPYKDEPAYDGIIQAFAGVSRSQANPETGEPVQYYQLFADKLTALTGCQAISAALFARERGAGGQHIKLSMADAVVGFLWADVAGTAAFEGKGLQGEEAQPGLSVSKGARLMKFIDGYGITSPVTDKQFAGMCRAFGLEVDPRFATLTDRNNNADALMDFVRDVHAMAAKLPLAESLAAMQAEGVPCSTAQHLADLPDHPQFQACSTFARIDNPTAGTMIEPNTPATFLGTPPPPLRPAASLGQHTDEILTELGHDASAIATLKKTGVVG